MVPSTLLATRALATDRLSRQMPHPIDETRPRYRSKTATAWLALLLGTTGAHRLYLYGLRDRLAWLFPLPTLIGLGGAIRMSNLGTNDTTAGLMVIPLGIMLSVAMLTAIVTALTPDDKWNERHNPGLPARSTGWGAVLAAVVGLFVGATVLMSTIAFGGQRFFESMLPAAPAQADARTTSR
jgi:hypothetical protein